MLLSYHKDIPSTFADEYNKRTYTKVCSWMRCWGINMTDLKTLQTGQTQKKNCRLHKPKAVELARWLVKKCFEKLIEDKQTVIVEKAPLLALLSDNLQD